MKRMYFPFVLREPELLRSAGGRVSFALWAYADPPTAVPSFDVEGCHKTTSSWRSDKTFLLCNP